MSELLAETPGRASAVAPITAPAAVCVPVRDEAARLPALLLALAGQVEAGDCRLCLLFDGDQPALRRRAWRLAEAAGLALTCRTITRRRRANAGRARRAAMALGLETLADRPDAQVLTTDADTIPAHDWIAASRAALAEVDVVAGHIRREAHPPRPARDRLERYLEDLYRLERAIDPIDYEPPPGHPSLGGASLGFRAEVYRALGGFRASPSAEDITLAYAARRRGYRLRRDRAVRVTTASRLIGRARGGLADELRHQDTASQAARVEPPTLALARFRRSALARRVFTDRSDGPALSELARRLDRPLDRLATIARQSPSADAFALRVAIDTPEPRRIDLASAEVELAYLLCNHAPAVGHEPR